MIYSTNIASAFNTIIIVEPHFPSTPSLSLSPSLPFPIFFHPCARGIQSVVLSESFPLFLSLSLFCFFPSLLRLSFFFLFPLPRRVLKRPSLLSPLSPKAVIRVCSVLDKRILPEYGTFTLPFRTLLSSVSVQVCIYPSVRPSILLARIYWYSPAEFPQSCSLPIIIFIRCA